MPREFLGTKPPIKVGPVALTYGTGSPEGVVTGNVGDIYYRTDGGSATTMYVKESGNATNTGWIGYGAPGGSFTFTRGGTILNPTAGLNVIIWRAPFACTVTAIKGYRVGGTGATINARRNGASNHLASDLSLTSADTWTDGGSVQNTAYAIGDKLEIMSVTVAGQPTQVSIQVDLTKP